MLGNLIKRKRIIDHIAYILIIALGIVADQVTKLLTVKLLEVGETFPIIEGVIHFTHVQNRGAAFGMLADAPWVFNILSTVMIIGLLAFLFLGMSPNILYTVSTTLIISGGIGNMIDRMSLKYVVDFIDFRLINFAVFNVADSIVCIGAGIMILALILDIVHESKNK